MKKPGFSPATIALVVVMLGALIMVSKLVTPPPAAPPPSTVTPTSAKTEEKHDDHDGHDHGKETPAAPAKPKTEAEMKAEKAEMEKKMREYYMGQKKQAEDNRKREAEAQKAAMKRMQLTQEEKGQKPLKYDPTASNIDAKFFNEMPMGEKGIEATDRAVALAEEVKAKMQKKNPPKPGAPNGQPIPAPPTNPPLNR